MKHILFTTLGVLFLYVFSTSCKENKDDVYLYLTLEQKAFILGARTGDTAIWESDGGIRDTGVVGAINYGQYVVEEPRNAPKKIGESAGYTYKIIGTNKLEPLLSTISIRVYAHPHYNTLKYVARYNFHLTTGVSLTRHFGGVPYSPVYWWVYGNGVDTVFFNQKGFLGYYKAGVRVEKVK